MYISQLDLAKIPKELLENGETDQELYRNRPWRVNKNGREYPSGHYQRCQLTQDLEQWIKRNITQDYRDAGMAHMYGEEHNAPHTDSGREYTLIYLTDLGGQCVKTVFYREKGYDLIRPVHHRPNYDDLEQVAEFQLELATWYLIDSRIIHSVEGIETDRKSIQIGFDRRHAWAHKVFN